MFYMQLGFKFGDCLLTSFVVLDLLSSNWLVELKLNTLGFLVVGIHFGGIVTLMWKNTCYLRRGLKSRHHLLLLLMIGEHL